MPKVRGSLPSTKEGRVFSLGASNQPRDCVLSVMSVRRVGSVC